MYQKLYITIKGEEMINNVNELTGKEWLHNAINFWTMDSDDIEAIYDKIKGFCYKDRTQVGYIKNIDDIIVKSADFTFNFVKSIHDAEESLKVIYMGQKKSYHIIFLENEFVQENFIFPFFTKNLIKYDVEYRGKIVVSNRENDKIYYMLVFLKTCEDEIVETTIDYPVSVKKNLEKPYIIDTRSKMDKIGLKHPAPFSYIDIEKICRINDIRNKNILDPFLGVGSTIIGAYKENDVIGIELNPEYVDLTYERLDFLGINEALNKSKIVCGNSLLEVKNINEKFDVVITSPPYFNILKNKTSGVRTDSSQSRQGVEYYSESKEDIGNCDNYSEYLKSIKSLFEDINVKMNENGEVYLIISDFTINKKETDIHSDCVRVLNEAGYVYCGTSYILQNQKAIYPFGYPHKIVLNHIYQYIIKFRKEQLK